MTTAQVALSDFPTVEEPIRAELFSVERLEQHAETSRAAAQTVTSESRAGPAADFRAWRKTGVCCWKLIAPPPVRFRKNS